VFGLADERVALLLHLLHFFLAARAAHGFLDDVTLLETVPSCRVRFADYLPASSTEPAASFSTLLRPTSNAGTFTN
jgi:hypothetical protein